MNKDIVIMPRNLDCYFANEYIHSYLDDDMSEENKARIKKHLKDCPYCAYDYENQCEIRKKVGFELEKNNKIASKIFISKIIEYGITIGVAILFLASLFFFFVKLHTFSKVDKSNLEVFECHGSNTCETRIR